MKESSRISFHNDTGKPCHHDCEAGRIHDLYLNQCDGLFKLAIPETQFSALQKLYAAVKAAIRVDNMVKWGEGEQDPRRRGYACLPDSKTVGETLSPYWIAVLTISTLRSLQRG